MVWKSQAYYSTKSKQVSMVAVHQVRLLTFAQGLLSPKGRFYLVALKQNNIPVICERMHKSFNLQSHVRAYIGYFIDFRTESIYRL